MAAIPTLQPVSKDATLEELREHVAILQKTIAFALTSNLGSQNAYEFGNWLVTDDSLISENGAVGFSTTDTVANDIRIWAGNVTPGSAAFRVYEDGTMFATNGNFTGTITGGTVTGTVINTAASGRRIVLNGNLMEVYDSANVRRMSINDPTIEAQSSITFFRTDGTTKAMSIYHQGSTTFIDAGPGITSIEFTGNVGFGGATVNSLTISSVLGLPSFISSTNTSLAGKANAGGSTSSVAVADNHNHGFSNTDFIQCYDGVGTPTVKKQWVGYTGSAGHSHTI